MFSVRCHSPVISGISLSNNASASPMLPVAASCGRDRDDCSPRCSSTCAESGGACRHSTTAWKHSRHSGVGLLGGYTVVDVAHKVVGVGSLGLRAHVALLEGSSPKDVVFLQLMQALQKGPDRSRPRPAPCRWNTESDPIATGIWPGAKSRAPTVGVRGRRCRRCRPCRCRRRRRRYRCRLLHRRRHEHRQRRPGRRWRCCRSA